MSKVKCLKITNKSGLVNYAPLSNKTHLEKKNAMYMKMKKPEECLKIEVIDIEESELVFIEGEKNKAHAAFDQNHLPPAKAAEKLKEVSSENETLKNQLAELQKQLETKATQGSPAKAAEKNKEEKPGEEKK